MEQVCQAESIACKSKSHELAWAAGFFDGEGCASVYQGLAKLTIQQTDPYVLRRFMDAVGGLGKLYGPYPAKRINTNPTWQWRACRREQVKEIIEQLWDYLSPIKQTQAGAILRSKPR